MEPYLIPKTNIQGSLKSTPWVQRFPKSWSQAAGLLRNKHKAMEEHLKKIRKEWDRLSSSRP